jgi:hypothetical protein
MEEPVSPDAPNKPTQDRAIGGAESFSSTFTDFVRAVGKTVRK